jgi:hypothetical protein
VRIELIQQPDDYTCGVACACMVSGKPLQECLRLAEPTKSGMTPDALDVLLLALGVKFRRYMRPRMFKAVHIITVPSLNVQAGFHYIVASLENAVLEVYDPQRGRQGKLFYGGTNDTEGIKLRTYAEVVKILTR